MTRKAVRKVSPNHLLTLAVRRVKIPALPFRIEYDADVDTLNDCSKLRELRMR